MASANSGQVGVVGPVISPQHQIALQSQRLGAGGNLQPVAAGQLHVGGLDGTPAAPRRRRSAARRARPPAGIATSSRGGPGVDRGQTGAAGGQLSRRSRVVTRAGSRGCRAVTPSAWPVHIRSAPAVGHADGVRRHFPELGGAFDDHLQVRGRGRDR